MLSVGRTGQCWDNAVAESFFATIKRELIDTRAWPTRAGLRAAILDWIEGWYNTRRRHSSLGYLSPTAYEAAIDHTPFRRHDQHNQPVRRTASSPTLRNGACPYPPQPGRPTSSRCRASQTGPQEPLT